ncbi:MAG TPA: Hsp70 family protein, partial [Candidatus Limnocylindrales bacterium]|nr:Hsp70 family protein [Candidatus Limnocylindrales bacterium]
MAYSLGIDLGTTYSAAAVARGDRLEIFQLGERAATIPSIVLLRADGEVLIGEAAERRALAEPTRTGREFKRRLGDPTPIILGGTPYGAEALLAHLLRSIVARVTQQFGEGPAAVALCHPASYGPYKLDLLQQAVRQADIGQVTLLAEPEAAALDYARQERVPSGSVVAVYDFGGGTFDATILRKTDDGFELLGQPEGLERLGGIDFDEALFRRAMEHATAQGVQVDANEPATMAAIARLRDECRRAKEALSSDTDATIPIVLPGLQTEMRLTRAEFEDMIRPRIRETIEALGRATRSAGFGFGDVDRILLVGGSSRIPLVAEMVREATGRPVAVDAHPKHTMALGAAFVAERQRVATEPTEVGGVAAVAVGAVAVPAAAAAAGALAEPPPPDVVASPPPDTPASGAGSSGAPTPPSDGRGSRNLLPIGLGIAAVALVGAVAVAASS